MMNAMNTSNNEYELQPFDVLCGRDKKCYNNIGNRRFRILINSNLPRYLHCPNRASRSAMIGALTKELCCCETTCSPIRFFKKQKHNEELIKLDFKGCREKIGHALRDAASQHSSHNKCRNTATAKSNDAIQEQGKERSMNAMQPLPLNFSNLLEHMSATFSTNMNDENSNTDRKNHRYSHRSSIGLSISSFVFDNLTSDDPSSMALSGFDISRNPNKNDNDPIPFAFAHRTSNISVLTAAFDEFSRTSSSSLIECFAV